MKKNLIFVIVFLISLLLFSCNSENDKKILPDLTNLSREEIREVLDKKNINYQFKFANQIVTNENDLDKFVCYNGNLKAGDIINSDYVVYVYTTVLPLKYSIHENVKLNIDYENKVFTEDGIGEVTFVRGVDGDTAWFRDIGGNNFKLRFLGVDTPEISFQKDPWGMAAANYTTNILTNAKKIVLEAESIRKDTYDRYLGFVWVDDVLLNLLIIEEAYSNSTLSSSRYEEYFREVSNEIAKTGRRFFGEIDPDYDYERKQFK